MLRNSSKYKFFIENSTGNYSREVFPSNANAFNITWTRKIENGLYYYEKTLNLNEVLLINKADEGITDFDFMREIEAGGNVAIGKYDKFFFVIKEKSGDLLAGYVSYSFHSVVNVDKCLFRLKIKSETHYTELLANYEKKLPITAVGRKPVYEKRYSEYKSFCIADTGDFTTSNEPDNLDLVPSFLEAGDILYYRVFQIFTPQKSYAIWYYLWEEITLPPFMELTGAWRIAEETEEGTKWVRSWSETLESFSGSYVWNLLLNESSSAYTFAGGNFVYPFRPGGFYYLTNFIKNASYVDNLPAGENPNQYQAFAHLWWYNLVFKSGNPVTTYPQNSQIIKPEFYKDLEYRNARRYYDLVQAALNNTISGYTYQSEFFTGGINRFTLESTRLAEFSLITKNGIKAERLVLIDDDTEFDLKSLLNIAGMFDCFGSIQGNIFRIEHRSYYENGRLYPQIGTGNTYIDTTSIARKDFSALYINKLNNYEYLEQYFISRLELKNDNELPTTILDYRINQPQSTVQVENSFIKISNFSNDFFLCAIFQDLPANDIPYIFLESESITPSTELTTNAHLYPQKLLYYYHRWNSPTAQARMSRIYFGGDLVDLEMNLAYCKRQTVSIPICQIIEDLRLYEYFKTQISNGILESAVLNIKTGMITLNTLHR